MVSQERSRERLRRVLAGLMCVLWVRRGRKGVPGGLRGFSGSFRKFQRTPETFQMVSGAFEDVPGLFSHFCF